MEIAIVDSLGWIGSFLLIFAYIRVSQKRLDPQAKTYQSLNLIGSVLLIINTFYYGAFPSTAVNIIWVGIGLFYLLKKKN
ncbi:MAG: CBU_0592 family membrane protein [Flavobacteriaceae bacterium]